MRPARLVLPVVCLVGCGTDGAKITGYAISGTDSAVAGDAIPLVVVETLSDGTTRPVAADDVSWTAPATVTSLAPGSTANSPLPEPGAQPIAMFLANPGRSDLGGAFTGVLYVLDAGSAGGDVTVSATVTTAPSTQLDATITIAALAAGDAVNGKALYGSNCASCHGATGDGTPMNPDGSFTLDAMSYSYPAPALNAADPDNLGADPGWNAALLAFAARADTDNGGVTLREPMPDWFVTSSADNAKLSTADFADIYAYLHGETQ